MGHRSIRNQTTSSPYRRRSVCTSISRAQLGCFANKCEEGPSKLVPGLCRPQQHLNRLLLRNLLCIQEISVMFDSAVGVSIAPSTNYVGLGTPLSITVCHGITSYLFGDSRCESRI